MTALTTCHFILLCHRKVNDGFVCVLLGNHSSRGNTTTKGVALSYTSCLTIPLSCGKTSVTQPRPLVGHYCNKATQRWSRLLHSPLSCALYTLQTGLWAKWNTGVSRPESVKNLLYLYHAVFKQFLVRKKCSFWGLFRAQCCSMGNWVNCYQLLTQSYCPDKYTRKYLSLMMDHKSHVWVSFRRSQRGTRWFSRH